MGKRNNKVWLFGLIALRNFGTTRLDESDLDSSIVLVVNGSISTDANNLGGKHYFVAYGRLAVEVISFSMAAEEKSAPLLAALDGWLRTQRVECTCQPGQYSNSVIVANAITFVVNEEIRSRARVFINKMLRGDFLEPPESMHAFFSDMPDDE